MSTRSRVKLLTTHYSLLTIAVLLSACRKEPPRPKVVNPMIDSSEKFTEVYTESVPIQTGLDAFLGIMSPKRAAPDTSGGQSSEESLQVSRPESSRTVPGRRLEGSRAEASGKSVRAMPAPDTVEPVYHAGTVEMTAIVHHVGLEGGFWGLTGENGQNYDPLNLPEALQKAGLRVKFWLRMRKDIATTHMWGTPVQIVAYVIPRK